MKRLSLLLSVILILGCTTASNDSYAPAESGSDFIMTNPVSDFSEDDITYLNISCSGSAEEIADCIIDWQKNNMIYCYSPTDYTDCTDPMRFNYMLPGIYPTIDIIRNLRDDDKIYGICFSFAGVYCSIAEYYGLECRVMNSLTKPSDRTGESFGRTGMSPDEYNRLKLQMDNYGYDYSYELMRLIAEETAEHYWAEVRINGEWVVKDGSAEITGFEDPEIRYKLVNDFEVTDWTSRDPNTKISMYAAGTLNENNAFQERESNNLITNTPEEDYAGITDDLGQAGRSASIGDYMQGKGLAPYYNSCTDVCNVFFEGQSWCMSACESDTDYFDCYESCSGVKFYKICSFTCDESSDYASCYESCSNTTLDAECDNNC